MTEFEWIRGARFLCHVATNSSIMQTDTTVSKDTPLRQSKKDGLSPLFAWLPLSLERHCLKSLDKGCKDAILTAFVHRK